MIVTLAVKIVGGADGVLGGAADGVLVETDVGFGAAVAVAIGLGGAPGDDVAGSTEADSTPVDGLAPSVAAALKPVAVGAGVADGVAATFGPAVASGLALAPMPEVPRLTRRTANTTTRMEIKEFARPPPRMPPDAPRIRTLGDGTLSLTSSGSSPERWSICRVVLRLELSSVWTRIAPNTKHSVGALRVSTLRPLTRLHSRRGHRRARVSG